MSDDFEDLLKRWLRDRAGNDRSTLQALAGNVATLPPHRREPGRLLPLVASVAVIVGLLAVVSPRFGSVGNDASPTPSPSMHSPGIVLPGGPDAFAGDTRLATCSLGPITDIQYAFEMAHGRDYQRYFPAMLLSPELDIDAPVFVVVYREGFEFVFGGAVGGVRPTPRAGHRTVCAVVQGERMAYSDVDITGLTVDVVPSSPGPSESFTAQQPPPPSLTPEPAPAWAGDPATALDCDGPPASIGPEPFASSPAAPDAGLAIDLWLARTQDLAVVFPRAGFSMLEASGSWQVYGVRAGGRTRAVIVVEQSSGGGGWSVVGVASCDPSEFDASTPLGFEITIWSGPSGSTVPTTRIREVADCYGGTQLTVEGRLYVWDPTGGESGAYDPAMLEGTFSTTQFVPSSATLTAFREGARQLYLAPDGSAVYVETPDSVQRWPHVIGDEIVRTDCN